MSGKKVTVTILQVIIDRGMATKIAKQIWPWELAVYEEMYGEGGCIKTGTRELETVLPDASDEFVKLSSALGAGEGSEIPFVELAYGRGKHGVKSLEAAIKDAKVKRKVGRKSKASLKPKPKSDPKPDEKDAETGDPGEKADSAKDDEISDGFPDGEGEGDKDTTEDRDPLA